jgi:hypothetical protein
MTILKDDFHKHMKEITAGETAHMNPYDLSQFHNNLKRPKSSMPYFTVDPYNNSLIRDTLIEQGINQLVHTMSLSGNNDIYKEARYTLKYLKDYCSSVLGNDLLYALDDTSKKMFMDKHYTRNI